jgi:endoglucanase
VNAIRETGGNNTLRHLMVPTHAANASTATVEDLEIPNDDPRIIVSLHTYYPYEISLGNGSEWGSNSDREEMARELDRIYELLPAQGRAVVIGEWGTVHRDNTDIRVDHAETYARLVRERGMCPIWWDNGALAPGSDGFGLLDRHTSPPAWAFEAIATGLVEGSMTASP